MPPTPVEQLRSAGLIAEPLTSAEEAAVNGLSQAQIDQLIAIGNQLKGAYAPVPQILRPFFI